MAKQFKMERYLDLCWDGKYFITLHAYPCDLHKEDYGKYEWRYKLNPDDKDYVVIPYGNGHESFVNAREVMREVGKTVYIYCHVTCEGHEFDTEHTCVCNEDTFDSQLLRNSFENVGTLNEQGNGNKSYKIENLWERHNGIAVDILQKE